MQGLSYICKSVSVIHCISKLENKNHILIKIDKVISSNLALTSDLKINKLEMEYSLVMGYLQNNYQKLKPNGKVKVNFISVGN